MVTEFAPLPHVFNCILQQCMWDGTTHKQLIEGGHKVARKCAHHDGRDCYQDANCCKQEFVQAVEHPTADLTTFHTIDLAPRTGATFFAIGDNESAIVRFAPRDGATHESPWLITHLCGLGQTISSTLYAFHSFAYMGDLDRALNKGLHPEYYAPPSLVAAQEKLRKVSTAHDLLARRLFPSKDL